jgi:hypothetical protein
MVSLAEKILLQTPILDSRGQNRGTIGELLNGELFISLFDRYGRSRVGITQEGDQIGVMLYDDFLKPRLYFTLKKAGRPRSFMGPMASRFVLYFPHQAKAI